MADSVKALFGCLVLVAVIGDLGSSHAQALTNRMLRAMHARYDCDDRVCSEDKAPVCDNTGKFYDNDCEWNKERCKQDKEGVTLIVKHAYEAEDGELKCGAPESRFSPAAFRALHARYDCDDRICSEDKAPVCDNTGKFYDNDCEWNKERCKQDRMGLTLMLKHAYMDDGILKCDGFLARHSMDRAVASARYDCDDRSCSEDFAPVCDNNGKLYRNDCEWNKERCKQDLEGVVLTLEHAMNDNGEMKCLGAISRAAPQARAAHARYDCMDRICSTEYAPVCDQNGRIYHNDCEWNKVRCQSAKMGKKIEFHEVISNGGKISCIKHGRRRMAMSRMPCNWDCPDDYEPVCDTTGKEYKNICNFAQQKCLDEKIMYQVPKEGEKVCGAASR